MADQPIILIKIATSFSVQGKYENNWPEVEVVSTLRWIFQCFQGIHVVFLNGVKQISNLRTERCLTLSFFPEKCQQYYILSG